MAFDFRVECGWIGARFPFTNCPPIPTRETPTGSGPAGARVRRGGGSVDDGEDHGSTVSRRLAAAVLVFAQRGHGAAEDGCGAGEREASEGAPLAQGTRERG